jgi:hypothetical protein
MSHNKIYKAVDIGYYLLPSIPLLIAEKLTPAGGLGGRIPPARKFKEGIQARNFSQRENQFVIPGMMKGTKVEQDFILTLSDNENDL